MFFFLKATTLIFTLVTMALTLAIQRVKNTYEIVFETKPPNPPGSELGMSKPGKEQGDGYLTRPRFLLNKVILKVLMLSNTHRLFPFPFHTTIMS